jgi:hypothetical protein
VLFAVAFVAAGATYLVARVWYASLPLLPVYAPLWLVVLAVIEVAQARSVRARLAGRPRTRPIEPIAVARTAALAKATSPVGALVLGWNLGLLGYVLDKLDATHPAHDARIAIAGGVAALLLIAAALYLERVCRVPEPPAGDEGQPAEDEPAR